jgi:hypothetical protein
LIAYVWFVADFESQTAREPRDTKHVADAEALIDLWIAIDRGALPQPHAEKGGRIAKYSAI